MANEEEANAARQKHGRDLLKQGVHAIGIEQGTVHGKKGWVVVRKCRATAKPRFRRR